MLQRRWERSAVASTHVGALPLCVIVASVMLLLACSGHEADVDSVHGLEQAATPADLPADMEAEELASMPALQSRSELVLSREIECGDPDDCTLWNVPVTEHRRIPDGIRRAVEGDLARLMQQPSSRALSRAFGANVVLEDGMDVREDGTVVYRQEMWIRFEESAPAPGSHDSTQRQEEDAWSREIFSSRLAEALTRPERSHSDPVRVMLALADADLLRDLSMHDWPLAEGMIQAEFIEYLDIENARRSAERADRGLQIANALSGCSYESEMGRPAITLSCAPDSAEAAFEMDPSIVPGIWVVEEEEETAPDPLVGDFYRQVPVTGLDRFLNEGVTSTPHRGATGWQQQQPVRFGLIDWEFSNILDHPAYHLPSPSGSGTVRRIISRHTCDSTGCSDGIAWVNATNQHGTAALSAHQSLWHTNDNNRETHSYGAFESQIRLCSRNGANGTSGTDRCMWRFGSLLNGAPRADVIHVNVTSSTVTNECPGQRSNPTWNGYLDTAINNGAFVVVAAGNRVPRCGEPGTIPCSIRRFPARSSVFVVGCLGRGTCEFNENVPLADPEDYFDLNIFGRDITNIANPPTAPPGHACTQSHGPDAIVRCEDQSCKLSRLGGAPLRFLRTNGQVIVEPHARTLVDVVAPTWRTFGADVANPPNYVYNVHGLSRCGTSNSSPYVAAAAVSVRDWAYSRGSSIWQNPLIIYVAMLLNTDLTGSLAPAHETDPEAPHPTLAALQNAGIVTGFSRMWGGGRLRMERPAGSARTLGNWWAGVSSISASNSVRWHRTASMPVSATTTRVGVVLAWDEPNIDIDNQVGEAANLRLDFYSTPAPTSGECPLQPPTGMPLTWHASDSSSDTKKRIVMFGENVNALHGRCTYIRLHSHFGFAIPPGTREYAYFGFRSW